MGSNMRISLVGTYHAEVGAVTIVALVGILERIHPEVVFAEIPRTHTDSWKDGSHGNLESIAVSQYATTHAIDVVPVDLPEPEESFFRDYESAVRAIERTSPEYGRLLDLNSQRTRSEGFSYLNSDDCIQAWEAIYREELETIEYLRRPDLAEILARVRHQMEHRELAMIKEIHNYSDTTTLDRGVFLVGVGHRRSLIEKLRADVAIAPRSVTWKLEHSPTLFY